MAYNNIPVNGWPQIKDLERLDALAQQIADMPTFTSEDRAFLEDLPSYPDTDGVKALMATTESGNTSLSYEEIPNELPADPVSDGVRVLTATTSSGTTVKSWGAGGENQAYSTTPVKVGTWVDGKDLYRKVVQFTTTNDEEHAYSLGLQLTDHIKRYEAYIHVDSMNHVCPQSYYAAVGNLFNTYIKSDNTISCVCATWAREQPVDVIIWYTTDNT